MLFWWLADAACVVGLVFSAYQTAKVLKASHGNINNQDDVRSVLRFWVMFGMLNWLSTYVDVYMRELKLVLLIGCFFPGSGHEFTKSAYDGVGSPLMKSVGVPVARRCRMVKRVFVSFLATMASSTVNATLPTLLKGVAYKDLPELEGVLNWCISEVGQENRRRMTNRLRRSAQAHGRGGASRARTVEGKVRTPGDPPSYQDVIEETIAGGATGGLHTPTFARSASMESEASADREVEDEFDSESDSEGGMSWVDIPSASGERETTVRRRGKRFQSSMPVLERATTAPSDGHRDAHLD